MSLGFSRQTFATTRTLPSADGHFGPKHGPRPTERARAWVDYIRTTLLELGPSELAGFAWNSNGSISHGAKPSPCRPNGGSRPVWIGLNPGPIWPTRRGHSSPASYISLPLLNRRAWANVFAAGMAASNATEW